MNETTKFTEDVVIAQFRFSLIAPVIQGLYPDASATAYFKRITEKPIRLPNGCTYQYSYKTVEKWATLYRNGGMEALLPRQRSDSGIPRALSDAAIEEIYRLKNEFPRLNATQIYHQLVASSFILICRLTLYSSHMHLVKLLRCHLYNYLLPLKVLLPRRIFHNTHLASISHYCYY